MKLFLVFILPIICLGGCSLTGGEVNDEFFPVILQERKVSSELHRTFSSPSRGRLSLVYTAPAGTNGKEVWLLLFERQRPAKTHPADTKFEGYTGSQGPVTLLVVKPKSSNKTWAIINSISLGYVNKRRKNYITLRWLQPGQQKGPVLIVNTLGGVGERSELIAFPDGWNQTTPLRHTYQDWMNLEEGAKYHFQSVDGSGVLCVTETHSDYTHDPPGEKTNTRLHLWNGTDWQWDSRGWH